MPCAKSCPPIGASSKLNFLELRHCEVRRIPLLRCWVNKGKRKASAGGKCAPNGVVVGLESPMPNSPALAITVSVSVPYKLPAVLTVMVLISTGTLVMELLIVTLPGGAIGKCCARTAYGHRCCRKGTGDQQNYAPSHWLLTSFLFSPKTQNRHTSLRR
jgi:hypothetical protein